MINLRIDVPPKWWELNGILHRIPSRGRAPVRPNSTPRAPTTSTTPWPTAPMSVTPSWWRTLARRRVIPAPTKGRIRGRLITTWGIEVRDWAWWTRTHSSTKYGIYFIHYLLFYIFYLTLSCINWANELQTTKEVIPLWPLPKVWETREENLLRQHWHDIRILQEHDVDMTCWHDIRILQEHDVDMTCWRIDMI